MSPLDKTVLVVEDNDISMRLYHAVLKALGYTVLQAKDGMEGWRLAPMSALGHKRTPSDIPNYVRFRG